MSSALLQELDEGLQALGEPRMRFYKLMSLFSFENGNEIHFGEGLAAYCNDRNHYDQLKDYIKEQKKYVRSTLDPLLDTNTAQPTRQPWSRNLLELRLWWLQIKLVEFGVFTPSEQRSIFPLLTL